MGFEYLTNIPLAKAREDYLQLLETNGFGPRTERIPTWDACGRVTARAVYAHPIRGKSGLITTLAGSSGYFCIDRDCEGLPRHAEIQVTISQGD